MKFHLCLSVLALVAGGILGLSMGEWLGVILAIGLVFCAEMFNTVLEELAGAVSPESSESVKRMKDMAAGAVLMASIAALAVAFLVYPIKILRILF